MKASSLLAAGPAEQKPKVRKVNAPSKEPGPSRSSAAQHMGASDFNLQLPTLDFLARPASATASGQRHVLRVLGCWRQCDLGGTTLCNMGMIIVAAFVRPFEDEWESWSGPHISKSTEVMPTLTEELTCPFFNLLL